MPEQANDSCDDSRAPWYIRIGTALLTNQGIAVVSLIAWMVIFFVAGRYAVEKGIPAHLAQINNGYEQLGARHEAAIKELSASHEASVKHIVDYSEKRDTANDANLKRVIEAGDKNVQTMREMIRELQNQQGRLIAPEGPATAKKPE